LLVPVVIFAVAKQCAARYDVHGAEIHFTGSPTPPVSEALRSAVHPEMKHTSIRFPVEASATVDWPFPFKTA